MSKATDKARKDALNEALDIVNTYRDEQETSGNTFAQEGRGGEATLALHRAQTATLIFDRIQFLLEPAPEDAAATATE